MNEAGDGSQVQFSSAQENPSEFPLIPICSVTQGFV